MQIIIRVNEADQRFDRFLRKYFKPNKEVKLTDIYSRIRTGAIKLNGRKGKESTKLVLDDQIDFTGVEEIDKDILAMTAPKQMRKYNLSSQELKKQILYEDNERIVRNKPSGIVVHEGNFHTNDINLNDYLESYLHYSVKKEKPDTVIDQSVNPRTHQVFKPAFAFRLDKDTSGVIVGAKTYEAIKYINKAIHDRQVDKTYLTIVIGQTPDHIVMDQPLTQRLDQQFGRNKTVVDHHEGIEAKTESWLLKSITHPLLGTLSLLKVKIYTGRMHQIRVHLTHAGYPVLGDMMYGREAINRMMFRKLKINRQLLHSYEYGFVNPYADDSMLQVSAPIPQDFTTIVWSIKL